MRNIFVISDTHFFHKNILTFKKPDESLVRDGFSSVEDMNERIIDNWNKTVNDEDVIYHLGDFTFGSKNRIKDIAPRLKGRKRLILGNHDYQPNDYQPYFEKIFSYRQFGRDIFKRPVVLCHFPLHRSAFDYRTGNEGLNIHGHLHHNLTGESVHVNVCVEHTNYSPVSIEDIVDEKFKNRI